MLGRDAAGMQRVLIGGWKRAAYETAPHLGAQLEAWHARRVAHVDCGRSRVTVGHWDLAALPV